jgi:hypothetical protein
MPEGNYLGYITLPVVNVLKQILPSSSIVLKAGLPFCEKKNVTLLRPVLVWTSVTLTQTV